MVLPASGALSMSQIRGEFGGSAPDSLSEYYRGGGLVPNITENNSIPTSGAISMSNFYSTYGSPSSYDVGAGYYESINPISGGTSLYIEFTTAGAVNVVAAIEGTLYSSSWVYPPGFAPGSYHIRADVTGGSFSSGTTGTDLALTSGRLWTKSIGGTGDESVTATFTLKSSSGGSTLASGSVTLRVASL